jgi:hypothetical protein
MNNKLEDLNYQEIILLKELKKLKGSIEKIELEIDELSISEKYNEIHNEYTKLNKVNLEALKRAIFIQWYAAVEPKCYTGIGDLNSENIINNISQLKDLISKNEIDTEFKNMIFHYYKIANWYFDAFINIIELKILINSFEYKSDTNNLDSKMINRGQMGEYWKSLTS